MVRLADLPDFERAHMLDKLKGLEEFSARPWVKPPPLAQCRIAIASRQRSAVLPDIATFQEGGLRGFESVIAHGVLVPAKTPATMVATLNRAINETLSDPEYKKQMAEFGADIIGGLATEFRAFLAAERTKWGNLIKKQGIKAN